MKKLITIFLMLICVFALAACAAGKIDRDKPVFVTENISRLSFMVGPGDEIVVPQEDAAEIAQWLATFRLGEKAPEALPPGSNSVRVKIEYHDGNSVENGLSTYQVDGVHYYLTSDAAPACYLELLDAAAETATGPEAASAPETEIAAQFYRAEAARAWFAGRNTLRSDNEGRLTRNGGEYCRVNDPDWPELTTLAALEAYLHTLFTPEYTQELLSATVADGAPLLLEEEGALYIFGGYAALTPYDMGQRQLSLSASGYDENIYLITLDYAADPYGEGINFRTQLQYNITRDEDGIWRFDHFHLPVERLLALMEFSIIAGDKALTLGAQQGAFPWGAELSEASRELWSGDGFDCFRIVTQEGLTVDGLRREDATDEGDGRIMSLITADPDFATYRGARVGMDETALQEKYPQAVRQDWPGTVETWGESGDVAYDYCYVTPESEDDMTRAILFGIAEGQVAVILLADGMDGRPF